MLSIALLKTYKSKVEALENQRIALRASNNELGEQIAELEKLNPSLLQLPQLKEILELGQKRELEMKTTVTVAMAQINFLEMTLNFPALDKPFDIGPTVDIVDAAFNEAMDTIRKAGL